MQLELAQGSTAAYCNSNNSLLCSTWKAFHVSFRFAHSHDLTVMFPVSYCLHSRYFLIKLRVWVIYLFKKRCAGKYHTYPECTASKVLWSLFWKLTLNYSSSHQKLEILTKCETHTHDLRCEVCLTKRRSLSSQGRSHAAKMDAWLPFSTKNITGFIHASRNEWTCFLDADVLQPTKCNCKINAFVKATIYMVKSWVATILLYRCIAYCSTVLFYWFFANMVMRQLQSNVIDSSANSMLVWRPL